MPKYKRKKDQKTLEIHMHDSFLGGKCYKLRKIKLLLDTGLQEDTVS